MQEEMLKIIAPLMKKSLNFSLSFVGHYHVKGF